MILSSKKKNIILSVVFLATGISAGHAQQGNSLYANPRYTQAQYIKPVNVDMSSVKSRAPRINIFEYHNDKLEEVILKLENAQTSIESDRQSVKSRLDEVNNELKIVLNKKKRINKQLSQLNNEMRTLEKMKSKIRNNIKKNEKLDGML